MKILITMTGPWGTGSGTGVKGIIKEYQKRGHKTMVFYPDQLEDLEDIMNEKTKEEHIVKFPVEHEGVYLKSFPLIMGPHPKSQKNSWLLKDLNEKEFNAYFSYLKKEINTAISRFRPDIIECHHLWAIDHVVKRLEQKFVSLAHNSDQIGFLQDKRMQPLIKDSAQHAEYIFALTKEAKEEIIDMYEVSPDRVVIVPNGYDQYIFFPKKTNHEEVYAKFGIEQYKDLPVLTYVGKMARIKGADVLLEANKILQEKQKALLLICGGGSMDEFTEEEQKLFNLENTVFLGHLTHQQISDLYSITDLCIIPSRSEGFCIAGLEAMGCGVPLVATQVRGVKDYAVGEVVEIENPENLAEGINSLLSITEKEYASLSRKAINTAKQYTWEKVANKRLGYYDKITI